LITRFVAWGLSSLLALFGCISLYYFIPIEDYLRTIPVTMNTNYELKAEYEPSPGKNVLAVESSPDTGIAITVSPNDENKQGNGTANFTREYKSGTKVSLTAPATNNGKNFYTWTKDGNDYDINKSISVTMNANYTLAAVYVAPTPGTNILTVQSSPDTNVSITVISNDNNTQSNETTNFTRTYKSGTKVSLTVPEINNGKNFYTWTKDGREYDINKSISVTMNANYTLAAVYVTPIPGANILTVQSSPDTGASIIVSNNDKYGQSNGTTNFNRICISGTNVSLIAPYTYNGKHFSKWVKNGSDYAVPTFWGTSKFDLTFFDVKIRVGLIICIAIFVTAVYLLNRFLINRAVTADFLVETEYEAKKVSWPSKNEYWGASVAVIISVVIIGVFIFVVDMLLAQIRQFIYLR